MANINKPTIDGVIIPYPDGASIEPLTFFAEQTTLGGTTRREIMSRKYKYTMQWNTLSSPYYDALETVVNKLTPVVFVYGKWQQSSSGILVLTSLSARDLKVGVGDYFWSSVTLECTEVNSRI